MNHSDGEAERFYRDLQQQGIRVRVGMEATGYSRWFERLLAELGFELWIGDPAEVKAKRVKKQKTDRKDAQLLLRLMLEDNFPQIWVPSPDNRDLRQLLWHRQATSLPGSRTYLVCLATENVSMIASQFRRSWLHGAAKRNARTRENS